MNNGDNNPFSASRLLKKHCCGNADGVHENEIEAVCGYILDKVAKTHFILRLTVITYFHLFQRILLGNKINLTFPPPSRPSVFI